MKRIVTATMLGLLALTLLVAMIVRVGGIRSGKELEHVYRVGFSHPAIVERVGSVRNVSVALKTDVPFFARVREDWMRSKLEGVVTGKVRLWIIGTKDGGFFSLAYTLHEGEGTFTVVDLDTSAFDRPLQKPNKAPEPTRSWVKPAADAPVVPAARVAHL